MHHFFLCVFLPVTFTSPKDRALSQAQLDTWVKEAHKRRDVRVFYVGDVLTERHRQHTISIVGDMDLPYKKLPVRTYKMWSYLGVGEHWRATINLGKSAKEEEVTNPIVYNLSAAAKFKVSSLRKEASSEETFDDDYDYDFPLSHTAIDTERRHFWVPAFNEQVSCDYYMKSDPDSYLNVPKIVQRLSCFNPSKPAYLGVVHVVAPDQRNSLFFGHGGSGYLISKGLIQAVGMWSVLCLAEAIQSSDGDGMEDVLMSRCIRDHSPGEFRFLGKTKTTSSSTNINIKGQIERLVSSSTSQNSIRVQPYAHTMTEFVLNFYETPNYTLNGTQIRFEKGDRVHLVPPGLSECILVVHPIDHASQLRTLHERLWHTRYHVGGTSAEFPPYISRGRTRGNCLPDPFLIATQAEVQLSKHAEKMKVWEAGEMEDLYQCWKRWHNFKPSFFCNFVSIEAKYFGLKQGGPMMSTAEECKYACCESAFCGIWLWRKGDGCWMGGKEVAVHGRSHNEDPPWTGGIKTWWERSTASRLREILWESSSSGSSLEVLENSVTGTPTINKDSKFDIKDSLQNHHLGSSGRRYPIPTSKLISSRNLPFENYYFDYLNLKNTTSLDGVLDLYIDDPDFHRYVDRVLEQQEENDAARRRIFKRFQWHQSQSRTL